MARKFCKHYRAMSAHKTCELGIAYDSIPKTSNSCPCWSSEHADKCDKSEYLSKEEAEAEDRKLEERFAKIGQARGAIVAACGGPWKRGTPASNGLIVCPCCGGKLSFSRSGYNGHIHAACSTKECVRWME